MEQNRQQESLAELRERVRLEELRQAEAQAAPANAPAASRPASPAETDDGFDAGEIKQIKYNLRPYVQADGIVPEPDSPRLNKFIKRVTLLSAATAEEGAAAEALSEGGEPDLTKIDREELEKLLDKNAVAEDELRQAVADLCNGSPTPDQIKLLPTRVFTAFFNYLLKKLSPEA